MPGFGVAEFVGRAVLAVETFSRGAAGGGDELAVAGGAAGFAHAVTIQGTFGHVAIFHVEFPIVVAIRRAGTDFAGSIVAIFFPRRSRRSTCHGGMQVLVSVSQLPSQWLSYRHSRHCRDVRSQIQSFWQSTEEVQEETQVSEDGEHHAPGMSEHSVSDVQAMASSSPEAGPFPVSEQAARHMASMTPRSNLKCFSNIAPPKPIAQFPEN